MSKAVNVTVGSVSVAATAVMTMYNYCIVIYLRQQVDDDKSSVCLKIVFCGVILEHGQYNENKECSCSVCQLFQVYVNRSVIKSSVTLHVSF